jgi:DNA-binding NarL/FixJ family response regulator
MRKAIRSMLSNREDISVVGEASNFRETIQKATELHPDLIILDVNMPDRNRIAPSEVKRLLNGARVLTKWTSRPTDSGDSGTSTG